MVRVGLIAERDHGRPAPPLYGSGIGFHPEPFKDGEHFDLPGFALRRGWADCDDLVIWRCLELQRAGEAAVPAGVWPKGMRRYHARVRRADGTIEDPSLQVRDLRKR